MNSSISQRDRDLFDNLFVLELANNHWGSLARGLNIINQHARVVLKHDIKAAIKLQLRDVQGFIHPDYKGNTTLRYVHKTEATQLSKADFARMVQAIHDVGCIPMATPFDEASVDLCVELFLPIIKIASSDVGDWPLMEKIASTRRPVILSSGGAQEAVLDDTVAFFAKQDIPLAINHCVSLYPSEDHELQLHQIDWLRQRYPRHVIGLSTHEYHDWHSSMLLSYAKGARTWERHIDIEADGIPVSPYCSLPAQCDQWYAAFHKAQEMCGTAQGSRRTIPQRETEYLNALVRGAYARHDLAPGHILSQERLHQDFYFAIPLHKGQISCREILDGEALRQPMKAHESLTLDHLGVAWDDQPQLKATIAQRGI